MPHQCVRCGSMYDDGDKTILTGCECGSKLFYYIRKGHLEKAKLKENQIAQLDKKDREKIEQDIYAIIGDEIDKNIPVVLDIESIKVIKPGKFEIDLISLFNKEKPLVYRLEEGKYVIDLPKSFKRRVE